VSKDNKRPTIGTVEQDLNQYSCPDCNSPFFKRGSRDGLQYVECAKCKRFDIIGPKLFRVATPKLTVAGWIMSNKPVMTETDVIMELANYGDHIRRYELMLPNVFTQHDNECDLFCVRKSGLCDEFEVKTSRADFLNDKKKFVMFRRATQEEYRELFTSFKERHQMPNYKPKHQALIDGDMCVNYFWYVVQEGVATIEDMPDFAGLITVCPGRSLRVIKAPKKLHKEKMSLEERYKIARKSTYRFWKLKNEQILLREAGANGE